MPHPLPPAILREYDIRGVFGETLGPDDARAIGRSFATLVRRAGGSRVAVGYDGRLSSPVLEHALVEGLTASGVDVVRIGLGPTPMLYFAEASMEDVQGGIQVTGSHNPANHNGFKLVLEGHPVFGEALQRLGAIAAAGDWCDGIGRIETREVLNGYVGRLAAELDGIAPAALDGLRLGWDTGNGAAGPAVEALVARLPGTHHLLFTPVDGTFPHHHPDPTDPANLRDLQALVAAKQLDFGVAFDGDGDRLGAIDATGRVIWGDQLLMIFAEDLLRAQPGAAVIADVKASAALFDHVAALGGRAEMWRTGHSLIKSRMKQTGAPLGGEMTGHLFFADRYFGFDDALYAAVRLIGATVRLGRSVTALRGAMPTLATTPELRFAVDPARKQAVIAAVHEQLAAAGAKVVALDGVRVETADGWWLLRASNTQDMLTARAEARDAAGLARVLAALDAALAGAGVVRPAAD
ncbi:phosphoglucomutase/phosphomannomutase PgmG [Novosphingobium piscinae]|uniref:Phosphomannomutase/phosphoglucomutase n=1 Tax=Novosphingobium piscinae TaxID=1507448 RepID=A0A7X1KQN4_9SPHN|nr:phosphomannomutase/phosphoglucomutase [Novosphingobium piscinae]MBC2669911.1 phosphomannomutase/phosphoglucomutase [Novosphingobium piscinae]